MKPLLRRIAWLLLIISLAALALQVLRAATGAQALPW